MIISEVGEKGLLDALKDFISMILESANDRNNRESHDPINVPIELGNSCRIFHGGVIRQIMFANFLKKNIEKMSNGLLNPCIVYYDNDTLPCILKDSRGISISQNNKSELITFGHASKKKSVMSQSTPSIESINKFLNKIRSKVDSNNANKISFQNNCIKELMDTLTTGCKDINKEERPLNYWYRSINEIILERLEIPTPQWVAVSDLFSPKSKINPSVIELVNEIYKITKKIPLWLCNDGKRIRISAQTWSNRSILLKDKSRLAPDVTLRQLSSSSRGPVVRLHGSAYDYFKPIDTIDAALGNLTIRFVYDHKVTSENGSISYLNRILDGSIDSYINQLKYHSLFSDIKLI